MATTCLNVTIINDFPIDITIPETIQITSLQTIDVDTALTDIAVSNFPAIQEISTAQTIDVDTGLVDIAVSNFPAIQEISTAQTIDVDTGLVDIAISNFPAIQEIDTAQTIDVDTGLVDIAISNFPAIQEIDTAQTINVDTGLVDIAISNFPAIQEITTAQTIDVDTGLVDIAISNFPAIQEIDTAQTINVDTGLVDIAISNFPAIQEISTAQTIDVDTGLVEIGISEYPAGNVSINIADQTLNAISAESAGEKIQTESSANILQMYTNKNMGINPLTENFLNKFECIYNSNYSAEELIYDKNWYESFGYAGATSVAFSDYGSMEITFFNTNILNFFRQHIRFYPYIDGQTMYVYNIAGYATGGPAPTDIDDHTFEFGLENSFFDKLKINVVHGIAIAGTISIVIEFAAPTNTLTILQSEFNIDKLDGTGASEFIYNNNWHTNKFFILTDNNFHFIFGLINGINFIPFHSFSQNNVVSDFSVGPRINAYRPIFTITRNDNTNNIDETKIHWLGFSIYKNTAPIYKLLHTVSNLVNIDTSILANERPLIAFRYRTITEYIGNAQFRKMIIYTLYNFRLNFYFGFDNNLNITGSTFANTQGNLEYDTAGTSFTGGVLMYSIITNSVQLTEINLEKILDWKQIGFDAGFTQKNIVLITINPFDTGTSTVQYSINFSEF